MQGQQEEQRETGQPSVPEKWDGDLGGSCCAVRSREWYRARSDPDVAVPLQLAIRLLVLCAKTYGVMRARRARTATGAVAPVNERWETGA